MVSRGAAAGVARLLTIGVDLATSRAALRLAERHPGVLAAVGIHPTRLHHPTNVGRRSVSSATFSERSWTSGPPSARSGWTRARRTSKGSSDSWPPACASPAERDLPLVLHVVGAARRPRGRPGDRRRSTRGCGRSRTTSSAAPSWPASTSSAAAGSRSAGRSRARARSPSAPPCRRSRSTGCCWRRTPIRCRGGPPSRATWRRSARPSPSSPAAATRRSRGHDGQLRGVHRRVTHGSSSRGHSDSPLDVRGQRRPYGASRTCERPSLRVSSLRFQSTTRGLPVATTSLTLPVPPLSYCYIYLQQLLLL